MGFNAATFGGGTDQCPGWGKIFRFPLRLCVSYTTGNLVCHLERTLALPQIEWHAVSCSIVDFQKADSEYSCAKTLR